MAPYTYNGYFIPYTTRTLWTNLTVPVEYQEMVCTQTGAKKADKLKMIVSVISDSNTKPERIEPILSGKRSLCIQIEKYIVGVYLHGWRKNQRRMELIFQKPILADIHEYFTDEINKGLVVFTNQYSDTTRKYTGYLNKNYIECQWKVPESLHLLFKHYDEELQSSILNAVCSDKPCIFYGSVVPYAAKIFSTSAKDKNILKHCGLDINKICKDLLKEYNYDPNDINIFNAALRDLRTIFKIQYKEDGEYQNDQLTDHFLKRHAYTINEPWFNAVVNLNMTLSQIIRFKYFINHNQKQPDNIIDGEAYYGCTSVILSPNKPANIPPKTHHYSKSLQERLAQRISEIVANKFVECYKKYMPKVCLVVIGKPSRYQARIALQEQYEDCIYVLIEAGKNAIKREYDKNVTFKWDGEKFVYKDLTLKSL